VVLRREVGRVETKGKKDSEGNTLEYMTVVGNGVSIPQGN
jgi:hypothetical protein